MKRLEEKFGKIHKKQLVAYRKVKNGKIQKQSFVFLPICRKKSYFLQESFPFLIRLIFSF